MLRNSLSMGILTVATWLFSAGTTLADVPDVIVSIKPVHSLAAGVMDGIGEPSLLIKGGASPHTYTLKPSDAEALQNADVVFWIGDEMETFLEKPLEALPKQAEVIALSQAEGVVLLPSREGGEWEAHEHHHADPEEEHGHAADHDHDHNHADKHDHDHATEHADEHAHGEHDMHIWLDPRNATAIVARMVEVLSEVDPENAPRYRTNGKAVKSRLAKLDSSIDRQLDPVKAIPFVVFHDAYQNFDHRYGLNAAGSITIDPDRKPSAQRIFNIRTKILDSGAVCVFSEPQFEPDLVATVIEGTDARTGSLDPLGADLPPGPDAYFMLMGNLATDLRSCLKPAT